MNKHWKTISSRLAFDHRWFKVQQDCVILPNGTQIDDWLMWRSGDVAAVIALNPAQEILMVRQYKHAISQEITEFPAGMVDQGETPIEAARREFEEETGFEPLELTHLATFADNPTKQVGNVHFFFAPKIRPGSKQQHSDPTVDIEVLFVTPQALRAKLLSGELWGTGTVAAGYLFLDKILGTL